MYQFYPDPMQQYQTIVGRRRKTATDILQKVEKIKCKTAERHICPPQAAEFKTPALKPRSGVDYIARLRRRNSREKSEARKNRAKRHQLRCVEEDELFGGMPIKNFDDLFKSNIKPASPVVSSHMSDVRSSSHQLKDGVVTPGQGSPLSLQEGDLPMPGTKLKVAQHKRAADTYILPSEDSVLDYTTFLRAPEQSAIPPELGALLNQYIERKGAFAEKDAGEVMRQRQVRTRAAKARREANIQELNSLARRILVAA